ncbi:MarR family winged helix-turn-helix transcriptional regulator [Candidatus Nephthysia bennettiae]|uniref:Winged helix-turn-helix transcriptional regulator n=1 Tax=Candidatus Nephthysia bennettiae TaxID=3127016 RepID=A0A934N7T7_9BACT|nr:winged helix-turn-helix transcriptional regulator [Candidatus Dormibacteraeota bacterium]
MADEVGPENFLIGALLVLPAGELRRRVDAAIAREGFSDYRVTHQPVFQWLSPNGDRITDLADRVGMTRQSMGELVDYLAARGYLERVPDPTDRRAVLVRRTEKGWAINAIAQRVVAETQEEWARALGRSDFQTLLQLLRRLVVFIGGPTGASGYPRRQRGGRRWS